MLNDESVNILFEGRHLRLVERSGWECVERARGVGVIAIIALTPAGGLLLAEQFRPPVAARVIELPAGLVGDEEAGESDFAEAARRELLEETGYEAGAIEWLTRVTSSAGMTSELVDLYLARNLTRRHAGGGVAGEQITVHEIPLEGADEWLRGRATEGALIDPRVYAGIYFLRQRMKRG